MKGVHKVRSKLATGQVAVYYYAWRGGPRIEAEPGSPEFLAAYNAAHAARDKPTHHEGTLQALITAYQQTPAFTELADATRQGYVRHIRQIEAEFGDMPIKALSDPRVRGEFLDWRDRLGQKSKRSADYAFSVLALILAWAYDRRKIPSNPCEKPGRLYAGSRADDIWTEAQIDTFLKQAPKPVRLPFLLAIWTGQRQADILKLTWSAYDGQVIRLKQSKTGRHMVIPVARQLREALEAAKARRKTLTICETSRGQPWTSDGFKTSFGKAQAAAGIEDVTFHDLRGTAVTLLALAGCSVPEIAALTGHSLKDAEAILSRHYLGRDRRLGESAMAKLEKHGLGTPTVKRRVKRSAVAAGEAG
ncbi:site-specific recombinase XerD [Cereibacter ovatus]|uniref:Site-specific recombinase XerD n=1 Tax=Cereibacter ovatus TaxID=439529 RepID=A0A285CXI8_9RHOB|nr:site-specific recombinase XerD [Cereibacter ovatus]